MSLKNLFKNHQFYSKKLRELCIVLKCLQLNVRIPHETGRIIAHLTFLHEWLTPPDERNVAKPHPICIFLYMLASFVMMSFFIFWKNRFLCTFFTLSVFTYEKVVRTYLCISLFLCGIFYTHKSEEKAQQRNRC